VAKRRCSFFERGGTPLREKIQFLRCGTSCSSYYFDVVGYERFGKGGSLYLTLGNLFLTLGAPLSSTWCTLLSWGSSPLSYK